MNVSSFTLFLSLLILMKSFVVCVCLAFEGKKGLQKEEIIVICTFFFLL